MTIAAIPTVYKGIQFRSRLEARWAVLFDALQWSWTYEPIDFAGWIPDFSLDGYDLNGDRRPIYVEVKPVTWMPADVCAEIERSGCPNEALILGTGPLMRPGGNVLGWLWQQDQGWAEAPIGRWTGSESIRKNADDAIGFCHETGSFMDRITGCYDGGCFGDGPDADSSVRHAWSVASNSTQWKAPA